MLREKPKSRFIDSNKYDINNGSMLEKFDEIVSSENVSGIKGNNYFPLFQKKLYYYEYDFIKSYLFSLHTKIKSDKQLTLSSYNALASASNPVIMAPQVLSVDQTGNAIISNDIVYASVLMNGVSYQVTLFLKSMEYYGSVLRKFFISILGDTPESVDTEKVTEYIISRSIENSHYKNKILNVYARSEDEDALDVDEIEEDISNDVFNEIFLPEIKMNEVLKFRDCILKYDSVGQNLRYLFSGKPGTGKTKTVKAIVNSIQGKATVLFIESIFQIKKIFDFAKHFTPVLVCIDDIDLMIGSRKDNFSPVLLSNFLQLLDGFTKNNIFLLATTNDKAFVDEAASRPGRFDLILDFGKIEKENYSQLINSKCVDERVLSIFDDEMIIELKRKKVTGAFIANMIKQIEIQVKLNPESNLKEYADSLIKLSHKGFYEEYKENFELGFN